MTSRKLMICLLASIVIRRPLTKDATYLLLDVFSASRCGVGNG